MAAARDALAEIEHKWVSALGSETVTKLRDALNAIRSLEQESDGRAGR